MLLIFQLKYLDHKENIVYKEAITADWITEPITDTQYAIEEYEDKIVIKFQGSCSKLDWLQNFDFLVKPYKHMEKVFFVHRGFLKKWKAVKDDIIPKVIFKHKVIQILGYSQGGALAQLCHEYIYFHTKIQPNTIVFGSPRVFGFWQSKLLKSRLSNVIRYENGNDIVPSLPWFWLGFKHYGKLTHIGKKQCVLRFSIKDHLNYEKNL